MGHLNGILARGRGNLNNNFSKSQMPGGLPGGVLKLRFDRYITLAKLGLVTALMSSYALSVGAKNWMGDQPQYHLKGQYVFLSFLLLFFLRIMWCYC